MRNWPAGGASGLGWILRARSGKRFPAFRIMRRAPSSHAPRHSQSAVRRSGGAEGHRAGSSPSRSSGSGSTGSSISCSICRSSWIDRKRVERLDEADVGRIITVALTPRRLSPGRGARPVPRAWPRTAAAIIVTLIYFQQSGLGEEAIAARRAAHRLGPARPLRPGSADRPSRPCAATRPRPASLPEREPVYPLSEGLTNKRLGRARRRRRWRGVPALARMDRAEPAGAARLAGLGARRSRPRIATRRRRARASGSPMTRCSPTSSP